MHTKHLHFLHTKTNSVDLLIWHHIKVVHWWLIYLLQRFLRPVFFSSSHLVWRTTVIAIWFLPDTQNVKLFRLYYWWVEKNKSIVWICKCVWWRGANLGSFGSSLAPAEFEEQKVIGGHDGRGPVGGDSVGDFWLGVVQHLGHVRQHTCIKILCMQSAYEQTQ